MHGFSLVFRALVIGPARRHPARVLLPILGVAIGVAAVAAIHHANRSVTESFREAASAISGRSDFVVTGVAGVPRTGARGARVPLARRLLRAGGDGNRRVREHGRRRSSQLLGVDWGGDGVVRDVRLVGRPPTSARGFLASRRIGLRAGPLRARATASSPGSELVADGRRRAAPGPRSEASSSSRASRAPRAATPGDRHLHRAAPARKRGPSSTAWTSFSSRACHATRGARRSPRRLPAGLDARAAGPRGRDRRPDGARLPVQPERARLADAARRDVPDRQRRLDRGPAPAPRDRDAASARRLPRVHLRGVSRRGPRHRRWPGNAARRVPRPLRSRGPRSARSGGTVSSIYLPTARIAGAGYGGGGRARRPRRASRRRSWRRSCRPRGHRACAPAPAMRPAPSRRRPHAPGPRAATRGRARARGSPPRPRARPRSTASRSSGSPPSASSSPRSPWPRRSRARCGARCRGVCLGRALGPAGRLARGSSAARSRTQRHRRDGARDGARHDARDDRDGRLDPRDRPRLGRVDAALGPLDQGGRRRTIGNRRRLAGRRRPRSCAASRASTRSTRSARVRPWTRRAALHARPRATFASWPAPAACPCSWTDGIPRAASPRSPGARRAPGLGAVRPPLRSRTPAPRSRSRRPPGPRAFRVAGVYRDYSNDRGTVVMDRALYLSLFARRAHHEPRRSWRRPGSDAQRAAAADPRRDARAATPSPSRPTGSCAGRCFAIFDRTFAVTRALEGIAVAVVACSASPTPSSPRPSSAGAPSACCARSGAAGGQIRRATLVEALLCGRLTGTLAAAAAGAASPGSCSR